MSWQQVAIDADSRIAERFADTLMELGALSTAIEDAAAGTEFEQPIFGEPGEPVDRLWEQSRIIVLFAADADVARQPRGTGRRRGAAGAAGGRRKRGDDQHQRPDRTGRLG